MLKKDIFIIAFFLGLEGHLLKNVFDMNYPVRTKEKLNVKRLMLKIENS